MYRDAGHGAANRGNESRARHFGSREPGMDRSRSRSPRRSRGILASAETLFEVVCRGTPTWSGAILLKNSVFPAKFHLTDGDSEIIGLMKDEDGSNQLKITQRLRLDQSKLDDVLNRIATSSSHAIFLGVGESTATIANDDPSVQTRPIRNLVSYLKQKEAAGVVSLLNKETQDTGILYSFPPCEFSKELLKRTCHNLTEESLKEDHLVIVAIEGDWA